MMPPLVDAVNPDRAARGTDGDLSMAHTPSFSTHYGPWALVTGASDGIGRAFAQQLAAKGLNLVLVARRRSVLDALAARLGAEHRIACRVIDADLGQRGAAERLADATRDLDVGLVVLAAGFGSSGPLSAAALDAERAMLDLNCASVLELSWHFARRLAARRRGGLVMLSSVVAFQGVPGTAHYAATKAYVQSLAEGLRVELAPHGVDVIASAPGPVHSGFAARAGLRMARAASPDVVAAGTLDALGRRGTVRPGALSKLLGWSLATAPRPLRVRILRRVMAGMVATTIATPPDARPPCPDACPPPNPST